MSSNSAHELLHRISRLASEADWTDAEVRQIFVEEGIDPSAFLERVRANVSRLLRESPLYWRNRAQTLRSKLQASVAAAQRRRGEQLPRKELLGTIAATLARMPPNMAKQFALEHRNFEDCTDEDLQSMLIELDCIADLTDANEIEGT